MYIRIEAKRWFQKTYGNTYHSVRVERCSGEGRFFEKELIDYKPMTYGYGDHYLNTAAKILNMTERELRDDIFNCPEKYVVICRDVDRKKDL